MAAALIDTNSWIELAKPRFNNLLSVLEEQVKDGQIEILVNEIILDEWERNKDRIVKSIIGSIKTHAKSAIKIADFLNSEEAKKLTEIVEKYREEEELQIQIANRHIERVESLLKSGINIPIDDEIKVQIANRALSKRAPFHNGKNNVADGLIIFSAVDYIKREKMIQISLIFVSANYKEFCSPDNIDEVHPEILEDIERVHLIFTNNIGRILEIKEENINDEETYAEYQFWNWLATEAEIARGK